MGLPDSRVLHARWPNLHRSIVTRSVPSSGAYRYLSQELNLGITSADPVEYVRRFASTLEVSDEAERTARDLLDVAEAYNVHSGRNPTDLAAAALYAATHLTNEGLTQATVSEVTYVSQVTIRNHYQELLDIYERQY
jgi:transcription initiation factor TFIIB